MRQPFPSPPPEVRGPLSPQRRYLPVPPYPAGQPLAPRRRQPRHSPVLAPVLALVGLLLVASASAWGFMFLGFDLDGAAGAAPSVSPDPDGDPVAEATIDPDSLEPTVAPLILEPPPDERADVRGTIIFSRDGDIWAASGRVLRKLTDSGRDTSPTWSPDGRHIYFIRTNVKTVRNSCAGGNRWTFYIPNVMRMNADGSKRSNVYKSNIKRSGCQWFSHVLEPSVSPDGKLLAVVSDGPNGSGPVVLHTLKSKKGKLKPVSAPSTGALGHNDPAFSPDGKRIAYTRNRAEGDVGVPVVAIHNCRSSDCTKGNDRLLRPGYAAPSWSPDGTWLAVEETRGNGRNIAIINARRGDPRVQLTTDGNSFAPVVSPDGDQIAYLRRDGLDIDLRVMTLELSDSGRITRVDDRPVTSDGAIDAESSPSWFIPEDQLTRQPDSLPVADGDGSDAAIAAVSDGE